MGPTRGSHGTGCLRLMPDSRDGGLRQGKVAAGLGVRVLYELNRVSIVVCQLLTVTIPDAVKVTVRHPHR